MTSGKLRHLVLALACVSSGASARTPLPAPLASLSPGVAQIERRLNDHRSADLGNGLVTTIIHRDTQSVPIPMRVGRTTTLQFQADETITDVMYDDRDALEDHIAKDQRKLTIRLRRTATVPGTAITTKRTYFFVLTPTEMPAAWYQGVAFEPGEARNPFGTSVSLDERSTFAEAAAPPSPSNDVFSGTPNFEYLIEGNANFRPVAVYDNGRFTWVQMPSNVQTMPAIFEIGANGLEVVNFVPHNNGTALLVNRLMSRFVLKIGSAEVIVRASGSGRR